MHRPDLECLVKESAYGGVEMLSTAERNDGTGLNEKPARMVVLAGFGRGVTPELCGARDGT